jgi:hypothetical protein
MQEPLASVLDNLVRVTLGQVEKHTVNGKIRWQWPVERGVEFPGVERVGGEGVIAYLHRAVTALFEVVHETSRMVFWSEIRGKPKAFAALPHEHNDTYYTKAEVDVLLADLRNDLLAAREET